MTILSEEVWRVVNIGSYKIEKRRGLQLVSQNAVYEPNSMKEILMLYGHLIMMNGQVQAGKR